MKITYTKTVQEILKKLETMEKELKKWGKKIDTIDSNVGTLMGREEYDISSLPENITSSDSGCCLVCGYPKEDCICFKPIA